MDLDTKGLLTLEKKINFKNEAVEPKLEIRTIRTNAKNDDWS